MAWAYIETPFVEPRRTIAVRWLTQGWIVHRHDDAYRQILTHTHTIHPLALGAKRQSDARSNLSHNVASLMKICHIYRAKLCDASILYTHSYTHIPTSWPIPRNRRRRQHQPHDTRCKRLVCKGRQRAAIFSAKPLVRATPAGNQGLYIRVHAFSCSSALHHSYSVRDTWFSTFVEDVICACSERLNI